MSVIAVSSATTTHNTTKQNKTILYLMKAHIPKKQTNIKAAETHMLFFSQNLVEIIISGFPVQHTAQCNKTKAFCT